ncbi:recombinase family protein [Saccharothrix saharensis]|uniref:recombinase family protein n=1 Tax=Saccharothrix saharensis TaxID=571190 RepID=UPI0036B96D66
MTALSERDVLANWMGLYTEDNTYSVRGAYPGPAEVGGLRFAFYGRTSTIEHQDPETSRAWQLEVCEVLVAGRGRIVVHFFDAGRPRRDRWRDRPEAAELLAAIRDPNRGFDAIVVGEFERGFAGDQIQHIVALCKRHGVQVWLPEAGGPLDLDDPEHRALIRMLGEQSLREVIRARHRAMAAMRIQTRDPGRYLGGRAPYGYRLVPAGPHPNLAEARRGRCVYRLEPDPETAPTVRWLFAERRAGRSVKDLVATLNRRGTPCPAEHDPERNQHRTRRRWTAQSVASILANPRYTGWQVWNRQSVDHDHHTPGERRRRRVTRWNPTNRWVVSRHRSHAPLVSEVDFVAVQRIRSGRPNQHNEVREYLFAGLLRCGTCSRRMDSHWVHGRPGYRCRHDRTSPRTEHAPATLYLREDHLITRIGHALHMPVAASPSLVAAQLRARHVMIVCTADGVSVELPRPMLRAA